MTEICVPGNPSAFEYAVKFGRCSRSKWIKKLEKKLKKLPHHWEEHKISIERELRFLDIARLKYPKRYNTLSVSQGGEYQLLKLEVQIIGLGQSASRAGYRAGLFVIKRKKVVVLFLGHHEDIKKEGFSSGKDCFKHLLEKLYPELYEKIKPDSS